MVIRPAMCGSNRIGTRPISGNADRSSISRRALGKVNASTSGSARVKVERTRIAGCGSNWYRPGQTSGGSGSRNGEWSGTLINPQEFKYWAFTRGVNVAMADSSAKFRRLGANINGRTDYRQDWMTRYNASGWTINEWQDTNFCHTLLYQPDFDFENFGTPIEW